MKILHLGDLHFGKKVNGFSMIEDQKYVINQIFEIIRKEEIKCVLLAGDIYDRSIPSEEATSLLDNFLSVLINDLKVYVIAISGNHDSSTRLDFSSEILKKQGLHILGEYKNIVNMIEIEDTCFYLMPFVDPASFKRNHKKVLEEEGITISSFDDLMKYITDKAKNSLDSTKKNIAIYHGFVVGSESENIVKEESVKLLSVGGKEGVLAKHFKEFDYVALGHLHGFRKVKGGNIYYSGSPLKYSFSEVNQEKKFIVIDSQDETIIPDVSNKIKPLHDMIDVRGNLKEILEKDINEDAYLRVVLTEEVLDAINKLRSKYKNVMELQVERKTTEKIKKDYSLKEIATKNPQELFLELSESVGTKLNETEIKTINNFIDSLLKEEGR